MSISDGKILQERPHIGDVTPTGLEDMSRENTLLYVVNSPLKVQLPSGLWYTNLTAQAYYHSGVDIKAFYSSEITLSMWLKWDALTNNKTPFHKGRNTEAGAVWMNWYGNNFAIEIDQSSSSYSFTPTVGVWYHFIVTYANPNVIWYQNGTPVETDSIGAKSIGNARLFYIGIYRNLANYEMDNFALFKAWNRALSAEEIAEIYYSEKHWFGIGR